MMVCSIKLIHLTQLAKPIISKLFKKLTKIIRTPVIGNDFKKT
jgi:hypothetical protein